MDPRAEVLETPSPPFFHGAAGTERLTPIVLTRLGLIDVWTPRVSLTEATRDAPQDRELIDPEAMAKSVLSVARNSGLE
jgi:hypothetical protein